MSARNIAQPIACRIVKLSRNFTDYFVSTDKNKWVNGRPVLLSGDVFCPMCETWHINSSLCQKPY